jgi:hypothetical protein
MLEGRPEPWLRDLWARKPPPGKLPPVRLIETQRLQTRQTRDPRSESSYTLHSPSTSPGPTVARYSRDLARRISSALAQYAARSQELDRTFPARLIAHPPQNRNRSKTNPQRRLSSNGETSLRSMQMTSNRNWQRSTNSRRGSTCFFALSTKDSTSRH